MRTFWLPHSDWKHLCSARTVINQSLTARNKSRRVQYIDWSGIRLQRMRNRWGGDSKWNDSLSLSSILLIVSTFFSCTCKSQFFSGLGHCSDINRALCFFIAWEVKNFVFYLLLPSKCNKCPGSWFLNNGIPTHGKMEEWPSFAMPAIQWNSPSVVMFEVI
jgi:hypothetical protein